jgi:hypothetical protein
MSIIFLLIVGISLFRIGTAKKGQFHTEPGEKGHLVWEDNNSSSFIGCGIIGVLYMLGLFVPLLFMEKGKGYPLLGVGIATLIYSLFVAGRGEFSSLWCFFSVIYAVVALFV